MKISLKGNEKGRKATVQKASVYWTIWGKQWMMERKKVNSESEGVFFFPTFNKYS